MLRLKRQRRRPKRSGYKFVLYEIKSAKDIDRAFDDLKQRRANALLVPGGPVVTRNSKRLAERAIKLRLPSMFNSRQFVEDGGLMAYGSILQISTGAPLSMSIKSSRDASPADLPVERPTKFEFVVNLKTAKQIGLTIPPEILARANRIIR